MADRCQHRGCEATPTRVPVIQMRLHRVFKCDTPTELVMGLELCDLHAKEVEGPGSPLLNNAHNLGIYRSLNTAQLKAGHPAFDLARNTVVTVPIEDERYQQMLAASRARAFAGEGNAA